MKRKFVSVLLALVLVLSFSLVTATPAAAATINVPGDYSTIGAAITAANPGDTITVDAATYTENVVIDKALTLQGATGATVAPTTGCGVEIQASDITVDGFSITTLGLSAHGIYISVGATGLTLTGNDITIGGGSTAIYADAGALQSAKSSGWTISGNTLNAAAGCNLELYDVDAVTVDNNIFMNTLGSNVIVSSELFDMTGPIVFTNNDVQGNDGGSMVAFVTDFQQYVTTTRSDTTVTTMDDVTITGNTFDGWAARGLRIGDWGGDVTNVVVNNNNFLSTGTALANNDAVALDAENNWWGNTNGPTHSGNTFNVASQGSAAVELSTGTIDYVPWFDALQATGSSFAPVTVGTSTTYHASIQAGILAASPGDTITCATGTFTEDLDIPTGKDNLELVGATGATIKGVATEPDASFPLAVPNIDILSSGVKIHGFTIEGPDDASGEYASGMLIGASDVEIYDNDFKVTAGRATWAGAVSTGIVTYRKTAVPTVDISGLNIHDNTFTNHGTGAAGFDAIFVNLDTGTTTATIADNEFTGNVARAISVERSNVVISGNSIVTDLAIYTASAGGYQGMYIGCFPVGSDPGPVSANVSITGNTVKGATTSDGFAQGIRVGHTTQLGLEDITVLRNTVQDCTEGITVRADATGVAVNYNEITGNTVGVQNDDGGVELDAEYNWYGGVAGPQHSTNPYNTEATNQSNDSVSDDVDFLPWMIHDTLVSGWNIWSTPIAAATGLAGEPDTNTVTEALDFWTADYTKVTDAYYFDSSSQAWVVPTSLTPLQAVYLKLSASATIDVCVSDSNYAPPGRTMHLGWNLVGTADWDDYKLVDAALLSAYYGTGAVNLIGYQYVISPSIHQTSWTFTRDGTTTGKYFVPMEGYWVYMVNQGVLNGFTYTPITP